MILLLIPAILGLLVVLAVLLRIVEIVFPPFSEFLDERLGEDETGLGW